MECAVLQTRFQSVTNTYWPNYVTGSPGCLHQWHQWFPCCVRGKNQCWRRWQRKVSTRRDSEAAKESYPPVDLATDISVASEKLMVTQPLPSSDITCVLERIISPRNMNSCYNLITEKNQKNWKDNKRMLDLPSLSQTRMSRIHFSGADYSNYFYENTTYTSATFELDWLMWWASTAIQLHQTNRTCAVSNRNSALLLHAPGTLRSSLLRVKPWNLYCIRSAGRMYCTRARIVSWLTLIRQTSWTNPHGTSSYFEKFRQAVWPKYKPLLFTTCTYVSHNYIAASTNGTSKFGIFMFSPDHFGIRIQASKIFIL